MCMLVAELTWKRLVLKSNKIYFMIIQKIYSLQLGFSPLCHQITKFGGDFSVSALVSWFLCGTGRDWLDLSLKHCLHWLLEHHVSWVSSYLTKWFLHWLLLSLLRLECPWTQPLPPSLLTHWMISSIITVLNTIHSVLLWHNIAFLKITVPCKIPQWQPRGLNDKCDWGAKHTHVIGAFTKWRAC